MRRTWLIAITLPLAAAFGLWINLWVLPAAQMQRGELQSGGIRRAYLVYVPPSYDPAVPTPLVISLHGFASWPANQADISRWNALAEREGFIVAYPSGTGFPLRWYTGDQAGRATGAQSEVAFIGELIDTLEQAYNLDPRRIYANGMSNGGGMANLLACQLSGRIAAVGGVAGAYLDPPGGCQPERPVPVIAFHGTDDQIVPYLGAELTPWRVAFSPVSAWAQAWAQRNGCASEPEALAAAGAVTGVRYRGCREGAEVILYTVEGGGHTWPGGGYIPKVIAGPRSDDVEATALMWAFFQEHPRE